MNYIDKALLFFMTYNNLSVKIFFFFSFYLLFPLDYIYTLVPCSSVIPHSGCQEQQDINAALISQIFSLKTEENGQLITKSLFSRYIFFCNLSHYSIETRRAESRWVWTSASHLGILHKYLK